MGEVSHAINQHTFVSTGKIVILACRNTGMVAVVLCSVNHQGWCRNDRCWVECFLLGIINGITVCKSPTMSVGMEYDVCPVWVLECPGHLLVIVLVEPTFGPPGFPHFQGELFSIHSHGVLTSGGGHEPVIPVTPGLIVGHGLIGMIGAVTDGHQHQMGGNVWNQADCIAHSTGPPVMTDQDGAIKLECLDKFHHVLPKCSQLTAAKGVR